MPGNIHLEKFPYGREFEMGVDWVAVFGDDVPIKIIVQAHSYFVKDKQAQDHQASSKRKDFVTKQTDNQAYDIAVGQLSGFIKSRQNNKPEKSTMKRQKQIPNFPEHDFSSFDKLKCRFFQTKTPRMPRRLSVSKLVFYIYAKTEAHFEPPSSTGQAGRSNM
jgi:hypothetical protein